MQIKTLEDFLSSSVMCFLFCNFHLIKVEKFLLPFQVIVFLMSTVLQFELSILSMLKNENHLFCCKVSFLIALKVNL